MKKFTVLLLILICLSFNIIRSIPAFAAIVVKEGFYTLDDLKLSPNTIYNIQNNSFSDRSYILIFDSNEILQQSVRLNPQSQKFNLVAIEPGYRIIIIGDGEVTIS